MLKDGSDPVNRPLGYTLVTFAERPDRLCFSGILVDREELVTQHIDPEHAANWIDSNSERLDALANTGKLTIRPRRGSDHDRKQTHNQPQGRRLPTATPTISPSPTPTATQLPQQRQGLARHLLRVPDRDLVPKTVNLQSGETNRQTS